MIGWLYTCLGERGFITADLFGKWRKIGGEESNYIKSSFLSTNKLKISDTSWSYKDGKFHLQLKDRAVSRCLRLPLQSDLSTQSPSEKSLS